MDAQFPVPSRPANEQVIPRASQLMETSLPCPPNIPNSPACAGASVDVTNLGPSQGERVGPPPVQEEGIAVTFVHWMDFNENVKVAHTDKGEGAQAPGVEARVLIGKALPVGGLNLRSCDYYRAPNDDMVRIDGSIPWDILDHYRSGRGSDARIILPLYKWVAPSRFILLRIAVVAFHIFASIVFPQALPQLPL